VIGYLGTPGALVALPYRGGLDTSSDRPVSRVKTLGGRVKVFVGARARREWSVSFDLIGSREAAGLVAVSQSPGAVVWYPADAVSGNMLSPQAAGFDPVPASASDAGLVALPDGTVARSVLHSGSSQVYPGDAHMSHERVPVRPGEQVTVGAWGLGAIRFSMSFRDAEGVVQSTGDSPTFTFPGWEWREYTLTAPASASFVSMGLTGGTQYARPSISWGAKAADRPGRGCPKAIVHGLSESLSVIAGDDAYGSIDVSITEVG